MPDLFNLWHILGGCENHLGNCCFWQSINSVVVDRHISKHRTHFLPALRQESVLLAIDDQHLRSADIIYRLAKENDQTLRKCRLVGQHLLIAWCRLSDKHRVAGHAFVDFIVGPPSQKQLSGNESG